MSDKLVIEITIDNVSTEYERELFGNTLRAKAEDTAHYLNEKYGSNLNVKARRLLQ